MPELIDKQAALDIAMSYCPDDDGCCSKAGHDIREMLDEIEALSTIEAEPVRHGRWEEMGGYEPENQGFACSACDLATMIKLRFCPHCFARMDGGSDNG
jgi:hypothetical protein